jgi:hypothetical protein
MVIGYLTPVESASGKLFWLVRIEGNGTPYTIERTFEISPYAEKAVYDTAKACRMGCRIVYNKL